MTRSHPAAEPPTASVADGRRLTARSVVASTLLGVSPPELPTRSLVATAELLGVAPGTARVAMSRMVAAGELDATADGYRLVGRLLLARQSRQTLSRTGPGDRWDGTWRHLVVPAEGRPAAERSELRAALAALRFAELREGVWLRPDNLPAGVLPDAEALVTARCTPFTSRPDDDAALAARLWDLEGWAAGATRLRADVDRLAPLLAQQDHTALAEGFVVSAAVLRHLQADPLLPAALTTAHWPGPELRSSHEAYDRAFKATLAAWLRRHLEG
ncbi:MAG: PaaX family transcriptional regulator [Acidimicrobiales bacterium]|nr:PaaX family transcriptional regulator [Acidimicrobiales bacterium]